MTDFGSMRAKTEKETGSARDCNTGECDVCWGYCRNGDSDCKGDLKCSSSIGRYPTPAVDFPGCANIADGSSTGTQYCYDPNYNKKIGNTCQPCTDMDPQCMECSQTNKPKISSTCSKKCEVGKVHSYD